MHSNNRRSFLQSAGAGLAGMFGLSKLSAAAQTASRPYQRPKLKITDVKTASLQGFHVRLYTDQGLTGDGEAVDAISGAAGIVQAFRFSLMNQDPLNVEAIWERIRTSGVFGGAQAGQFVTALTAGEIALWDLTGKALGIPIYQLRFVRRNRGLVPAQAACQVSGREQVRGLGRCESRRIFS